MTGVSLRVVDAYADVTGTVAELEETNPANYLLAAMNPQLALAAGHVLKEAGGGVTGGPTTVVFDEPLPSQDFAPQVQLVASADITEPMYSMPPPSPSPTPPWLNKLGDLTLRVPFTLGPARSTAYTYSQPPVVEQGVGVQVQLLDISPARTAFYGAAGGARVELRFSGLPRNMELLSFIRMEWQRATSDGTSGDHGPGQLELHIPGMTVSTLVMVLLQDPAWPTNSSVPSVEPVVGAAGTVQFEASFLGSGAPTGQPATLSISNIQRLTSGSDGNGPGVPSLPTYSIMLPLR
jgi:hypothetical protein